MDTDIIINGTINARTTYGVVAGEGFADALCAPVSIKDYPQNESRLEHGKKIITTNRKFDAREITLPFVIKDSNSLEFQTKKRNFVAKLQSGEITLSVQSLGNEVYHLIYTKAATYAQGQSGTSCKMSVKFIEPNPNNR